MNNLRDPFSLRSSPTQSAFSILRQPPRFAPLQQTLHQQIQPVKERLQEISVDVAQAAKDTAAAAAKTARETTAIVENAVTETLEDMSFQIPQNLPSFTSAQRQTEDRAWNTAFGRGGDLPMYKDKPYYSGRDGGYSRRSRLRRKRVIFLFGVLVIFALWWLEFFGNAGEYKERLLATEGSGPVDWNVRREQVKKVFKQSWAAYERDAWGYDEYKPISRKGRNMVPKGMGWIIVDSLDTLMIMNLTTELANARDWVEHSLTYEQDHDVNTFETTIRMLGGLLSAHYLQEVLHLVPSASDNPDDPDDMYLNKATDLANRLLGAYESPSGIPYASINLKTSEGIPSHADMGSSSTAEATTLQLEMKYLAKLTGETLFWDKASHVMSVIDANQAEAGLVPIFVSPETGKFFGNEIRLGSRGDSYYEYLIKQYLQTGKSEPVYNTMYEEAVAGIKKHLVASSHPSHLTFIGELPRGIGSTLLPKMDHLVCFAPGMLALGATHGLPVEKARKTPAMWDKLQEDDLHLARELMHTCYEMYNVTATGLAPEIVFFNTAEEDSPHKNTEGFMDAREDIIIKPQDAHNLQRPETVESLFIMWRLTGDEIYRHWGWEIFEAFVRHTKVNGPDGGYTSLDSVLEVSARKRDNMESFWLAETLKYLYLLFSEDDLLPLDKVVFNTEAHPLPIFQPGERFKTGWTRKERPTKQEAAAAKEEVVAKDAGEVPKAQATQKAVIDEKDEVVPRKKKKVVELADDEVVVKKAAVTRKADDDE